MVADTSGNDRYGVTPEATDLDGDLEGAAFELQDPDTGTVIDRVEVPIRGDADTATLTARGTDRRATYRIVAIAIDADGNTASDETTVSG